MLLLCVHVQDKAREMGAAAGFSNVSEHGLLSNSVVLVLEFCCPCMCAAVACVQDKAREMGAAAGFSSFSKLDWEVDGDQGWHSHYMLRP